MSDEHETQTEGDYKDFHGVGPQDFLEEHERAQQDGPHNTAYKGWGELLQHWYAWCEKHDLEPVTDFKEQTRLYVEAEDEASKRADKLVYKELSNDEIRGLAADARDKLRWEFHYEVEKQTKEVLHERGYITLFDQFTLTVNPETFEVEKQDLFKRPAQRNVPMYAKALYRLNAKSNVTWQDFYDFYVALLTEEKADQGSEFSDLSGRQTLGMVVATSKLAGHLNGFITNRKETHAEQLEVRVSGRAEIARAYSRLDLPKGTARPDAIGLLEKIDKTLLRHKEESARDCKVVLG